MVDIKKLVKDVLMLVMQPAKAWLLVSRKVDRGAMTNTFLLPLIAFSGIAVFVGKVFGSGFEGASFFPAAVRMVVVFFAMFLSYYLSALVIHKFSQNYTPATAKNSDLLTGYSMVIVLLLESCLGLFPNFRIIAWIAQFYTVKIVWDGAAVLMRIHEERRLLFTMVVSVIIIVMPLLMGRIMSALSVNLF